MTIPAERGLTTLVAYDGDEMEKVMALTYKLIRMGSQAGSTHKMKQFPNRA